uniref:Aminotran_5 domain-containing protein n=1 Tax=Mesocestoides corti TaxID=53468 RepID=A0A5K3EMJ2_MESCO
MLEGSSATHRLASCHRQFYTLPQIPDLSHINSTFYRISSVATKSTVSEDPDETAHREFSTSEEFFDYINKSVIGYDRVFRGGFGDRRVVYCDYIASGRSLSFIEDFIYNEVLPNYGNTHTTTSVTSLQTTMYRYEAKDIVRNAVRAGDSDAVFFVGSGCTGAVHKLIHNLHLEKPPIVITGPFEHHSNMLPWRHLAAKIVRLNTDNSGNVSIHNLEEVLSTEQKMAKKLECSLIVCLAAASNVTGILVNVDRFSVLVHRYGGLVFWDYATAAPYVKIDMNPVVTGPDRDLVYKDAVYFSMHKFAGEKYPDGCGGGSVCFVRRKNQVYLQDVEEREDGGTPAIVESIRAGLVMQLKQAVTSEVIFAREEEIVKRAWEKFKPTNNLLVLGGDAATRLPIFSVIIRHVFPEISSITKDHDEQRPSDRVMFLHHTFVSALLNDLFGIQCRSGCVCAGPYAMDLLGIDEGLAKLYEDALVTSGLSSCRVSKCFDNSSREVLRPGFTRFSIPYFMSDEEANFILDAVCFVADYGWAFLPLYSYNASTGEWKHQRHDQFEDRQWLGHIKYTREGMVWRRGKPKAHGALPKDFQECLLAAKVELKHAVEFVRSAKVSPVSDDTASFDADSQKLRWFLLPCEAAAQMRGEIHLLAIPTGPSSPWKPGTMDPCTNSAVTTLFKEHPFEINPSIQAVRTTTSPPIALDSQASRVSTYIVHSQASTMSMTPRLRQRSPHSSSPQRAAPNVKGVLSSPNSLRNATKPHIIVSAHLPKQRNNNALPETYNRKNGSSVQIKFRSARTSAASSDAKVHEIDISGPMEFKQTPRRIRHLSPAFTENTSISNFRTEYRDNKSLWKTSFKKLDKPLALVSCTILLFS